MFTCHKSLECLLNFSVHTHSDLFSNSLLSFASFHIHLLQISHALLIPDLLGICLVLLLLQFDLFNEMAINLIPSKQNQINLTRSIDGI